MQLGYLQIWLAMKFNPQNQRRGLHKNLTIFHGEFYSHPATMKLFDRKKSASCEVLSSRRTGNHPPSYLQPLHMSPNKTAKSANDFQKQGEIALTRWSARRWCSLGRNNNKKQSMVKLLTHWTGESAKSLHSIAISVRGLHLISSVGFVRQPASHHSMPCSYSHQS